MIEMYVFTVIALVTAGAVIGGLVVVSLGIRRDDHRGGFPADTNDRLARAARRATRASTRASELGREPSRHLQETLRIQSARRLTGGQG